MAFAYLGGARFLAWALMAAFAVYGAAQLRHGLAVTGLALVLMVTVVRRDPSVREDG